VNFFCRTLLASSFAASAFAATVESGRELEDNDIRALKEWIDTKRQISLKEVGGDLSLSGEVRTEFQSTREDKNGRELRGSRLGQLPKQTFDIEVNLMLDYRTDRTWAAIRLEFDNDAGVFSGSLNKLALERAYFGVRAVDCDNFTMDLEFGRRFMLTVFDSKVQFGSYFDGILFRYDHAFENVGDFYIHAGPFVINERRNHFGYVGEMGLLNIAGTGFYTKFSLIDWDTKHYKTPEIDDRFRFIVTQLTGGYRFRIESIKKIGLVYSAFLWNWAAERLPVSNNEKANWAAYAGVSIGQLLRQWDWAVDINYQVVAAQAIPDYDASGNGFGNADRSGFYTRMIVPLDGEGPSTRETAGGSTNYQGYAIRFDVLLTDKLDMQNSFMQSFRLNDDIGPRRNFLQYELEFIYSW
jgi:hypothetical protein